MVVSFQPPVRRSPVGFSRSAARGRGASAADSGVRVLLLVSLGARVWLAKALLEQGMQPILPNRQGAAGADRIDLILQEFSADPAASATKLQPALAEVAATVPVVGWIAASCSAAESEVLQRRAWEAGVVALVHGVAQAEDVARWVAKVARTKPVAPASATATAPAALTAPTAPMALSPLSAARAPAAVAAAVPVSVPRVSAPAFLAPAKPIQVHTRIEEPLEQAVFQASLRGTVGALLMLGVTLHRLSAAGQEPQEVVGAQRWPVLRLLEERLRIGLSDPSFERMAAAATSAGVVVSGQPARPFISPSAIDLAYWDEGLAIVVSELGQSGDADWLAHDVVRLLQEPVLIGPQTIQVQIRVGVGVFPHDSHACEGLIRRTTLAWREACAPPAGVAAKPGVRVPPVRQVRQLRPASLRRLRMESGLLRALSSSGFELCFQPQADLRSGALTGAEALLRWSDPDLGAVEPYEFIPLAIEMGVMNRLGPWVLEETCRQIRRWQAQKLDVPRLSINVAPQQLAERDFVPFVLQTLVDHDLSGGVLTLEITEAALLHDTDRVAQQLQALRAAGVRVAIDDFGSGQFSLAQLSKLAIDELKIDRVFLERLDEAGGTVAEAVIGLGHTLGLRVVAEGVETEAQLDFLGRHGCDEFQGYLLSRPLNVEAMARVLSQARIQHRAINPDPPSTGFGRRGPQTPPAAPSASRAGSA